MSRNGSTHQPDGSVSHCIGASVFRGLAQPPERAGDGGGVEAQQAVVGVGAGARLAEGVGVQLDDLDAEPVGQRVGVRRRSANAR